MPVVEVIEHALNEAIFLDRDGTIIEDVGYIRRVEDVHLVPGAVSILRALKQDFGYLLVVVSNQSGIGRSMVTHAEFQAVHTRMVDLLSGEGVALDGAYYCPHHPDDRCICRKPSPGLIAVAAKELDIDVSESLLIGNSPIDVECAERAGATPVLLRGPEDRHSEDDVPPGAHIVGTWNEVYDLIARRRIAS